MLLIECSAVTCLSVCWSWWFGARQ